MNDNPPPAEKGKVIKINYCVQVHKQPAVTRYLQIIQN